MKDWDYFHQETAWRTRDRGWVLIQDLDVDHADAILELLEDKAETLKFSIGYELFSPLAEEYSDMRLARKYEFGGPEEWDQLVFEHFSKDAVQYVQDTPLYRAILRRLQ